MRKPRSIRIVNYAVNGTGIGHLTRLVAVSRWLRRYAAAAGVRAEIFFLTSSEADGLLFSEQFASFKIPSKTVITEAGVDRLAYVALAKQWIWHSLGLLRPDLFTGRGNDSGDSFVLYGEAFHRRPGANLDPGVLCRRGKMLKQDILPDRPVR